VTALEPVAGTLLGLGFSQYEARTYVGLSAAEPRTGYAVAKATGVPQPKVYETLRRLVERGAAMRLAGEPARFLAVPPERLLGQVEDAFRERLDTARSALARLGQGTGPERPEVVWKLDTWDAVRRRAEALLGAAERLVYLAGREAELRALEAAAAAAGARGVELVVLHVGPQPFPVPGGRAYQHASSDSVLSRRRRARHLALAADAAAALWAVAPDGRDWRGLWSDDHLLCTLVTGYVRHDLQVQQIHADFPDLLDEAYGLGLERLARQAPARSKEPGGYLPE